MRNGLLILFIGLTGILLAQSDSLPESPQAKKVFINGYVKNLSGIFIYPGGNSTQWGLWHQRLNIKWTPKNKITGALEIRNRILYGEYVKNGLNPPAALDKDMGLIDLTFLPFQSKSAIMVSAIERAYLRYVTEKWEITTGRQRINWGVNLVWNPNDLFNTYSFIDFDYEERPGSDAARIKYKSGEMSEWELAVRAGKLKHDDVYALMYKTNSRGNDIQFIGGFYGKDATLCAGWAGSIRKIGFKGEVSYFHPIKGISDTFGMLNGSLEFDYTYAGKIYMNASYLYQSQGSNNLNGTQSLLAGQEPLSAKFLGPTKHSAFFQIKSMSSPIITGSISGLYFFEMNGFFLFPTLSYSLNNRWDIAFFMQHFWIKESTMKNKMNNLLLRIKYVW